jgi:hypothetical protein
MTRKAGPSCGQLGDSRAFSGVPGWATTRRPPEHEGAIGPAGELVVMDFSVCSQCGIEIEGKGIHYRDQVFCSDDCCEEFEEEFNSSDEPDIEDLEEEDPEDFDEEDLGYRDRVVGEKDDFLDDDYDIDPDDF